MYFSIYVHVHLCLQKSQISCKAPMKRRKADIYPHGHRIRWDILFRCKYYTCIYMCYIAYNTLMRSKSRGVCFVVHCVYINSQIGRYLQCQLWLYLKEISEFPLTTRTNFCLFRCCFSSQSTTFHILHLSNSETIQMVDDCTRNYNRMRDVLCVWVIYM